MYIAHSILVLHSGRAIAVNINIQIMRVFVRMRELINSNRELARRLNQLPARLDKKLTDHDQAIAAILSAIRELMNPPALKRRPIGFTADLEEEQKPQGKRRERAVTGISTSGARIFAARPCPVKKGVNPPRTPAFVDPAPRCSKEREKSMSRIKIGLSLAAAVTWIGSVQAQSLNPALAPGRNFDLAPFKLQTLDGHLQFKEVNPVDSYQDTFFFTDHTTGAMTFRVPSGAGHTKHSEYPRIELRERNSWRIGSHDGVRHIESMVFRVMSEPQTGKLIFAQIHGEKTGGSEALKMRWSHGEISMATKKHYGDTEERIELLSGLSLGAVIECRIELQDEALTVSARSGDSTATRTFSYDAQSWKDIPVYFKAGNYSQDKIADGSSATVAIERLEVRR